MKYNVKLTAESLRNYRKFKGWSRRETAAQIGMSENWIYKIEKQITPLLSEPEIIIRRKLNLTDAALIKFNTLAEAIENNG